MSETILNVLPVFLLILIGWVIVRSGYMKADIGDALGDFVFRAAVPVLLFRTLAKSDFHGASPLRLWLAYFAAVAVTWTLAHLVATRIFGRDVRTGILSGMSAAFANNVFIGLPLVARMVGEQGVVAVSILLAAHLPVMMVAGSILMENAERKESQEGIGASLLLVTGQVARSLVTNPLIIGIFAGLAVRLGGFELTGIPEVLADQIAGMAAPAALISLGMAAHKYGLSGNIGLASSTSVFKLMVLPALVWAFCHLLGLSPAWTAAMVLTSSVPTGVNVWLIANRFQTGQGLAASAITLTTATGFLSVSFWVWLMSQSG